jgi:fatty acid CoA ligase FadD9
VLPLLHAYAHPERPLRGALAPAVEFRSAVQQAKIGAEEDIPHLSREFIGKYVTDLELLDVLTR